MTSRDVRIAITNTVLSNTGDAAIYQAIVEALQDRFAVAGMRCTVVAIDSRADVTSRLYPQWTVVQQATQIPLRGRGFVFRVLSAIWLGFLLAMSMSKPTMRLTTRWLGPSSIGAGLREMAASDVVISSGGTYLVDSYLFLHRAVELRCAKALGKPVILWTQSVGPFEGRLSRMGARLVGSAADLVFMRDERSLASWRRVNGDRVPVRLAPDAVFGLTVGPMERASGHRSQAVLSVREWHRGVESVAYDEGAYIRSMREAAVEFRSRGWHTTALSTCQGVPSYAYDDARVADRILAPLGVDVSNGFHDPTALVRLLQDASAVVATRMHMAILGLLVARPVLAIAYEFKSIELFRQLGLDGSVVPIEAVTPEWMRERIDELVADPARFTLDAETRANLRESARAPAEQVLRLITSGDLGASA